MAHIFRHKTSRRLYFITHLLLDMHHLNRNGFRGLYAHQCDAAGNLVSPRKVLTYNYEGCLSKGVRYDPEQHLQSEFEVVAEAYHLPKI